MLYYYCRNATFASIIKNHSLWLSDMTQSNDSYEIHRYVKIVEEAIDKKLEALKQTNQEDKPQKGPKRKLFIQNENLQKVYSQAKKSLTSLEKDHYCLAICFSDKGDSLSQWRGYGDDGYGMSIGFDEQRIEDLSKQHVLFRYDDVKYYSSIEDDEIQNKLKGYIYALDCIGSDTNDKEKNRSIAIKNWSTSILDNDAPFYKPAGFIEERETRFCFVRYIHSAEMASPKETSHLQGIDFHVSNTAIIPHYELKLEDNQKAFMSDIIREVIIGPCNGSDINTVRSFLAKEGFDYSHIRIKKSGIPYRTRK